MALVLGGLGCGGELPSDPPAAEPQGAAWTGQVQGPSGDFTGTAGKGDVVIATPRPEGKHLVTTPDRLYFVAFLGNNPPADAVALEAVGTQPVQILYAQIVDNMSSPFGVDAAKHFSWEVVPPLADIEPGQLAYVRVHFSADTTEMQSAILVIRTDSVNHPVIQVELTGKIIAL